MSIETAFLSVLECSSSVERTLRDLVRWAVTEGAPENEEHVMVTRYEEAIEDALGLVHEIGEAAGAGRRAAAGTPDLAAALVALHECQQQVNLLTRKYYWELFSPDSIEALATLARERGEAWGGWYSGVRDALTQCRTPLERLSESLCGAWEELAGRGADVGSRSGVKNEGAGGSIAN